jgi:hypothetical protein
MSREIHLPKLPWWQWALMVMLVCWLLVRVGENYHPSSSSVQQTPSDSRKQLIESQFSSWDGAHRGLTAYIKSSMNDPASYKHVDTSYSDQGDYLIVTTKFRGKNAFGGVITTFIKAKVDLDGKVLAIIKQQP